jgi:hypothetical protein
MRKYGSGDGERARNHDESQSKEPEGDCREDKHRSRFARAIARSEFGRHHWDEMQETELRAARKRKRKMKMKRKS